MKTGADSTASSFLEVAGSLLTLKLISRRIAPARPDQERVGFLATYGCRPGITPKGFGFCGVMCFEFGATGFEQAINAARMNPYLINAYFIVTPSDLKSD